MNKTKKLIIFIACFMFVIISYCEETITSESLPSGFILKKMKSGKYKYTISNLPKIELGSITLPMGEFDKTPKIVPLTKVVGKYYNEAIETREEHLKKIVPECVSTKYDLDNKRVEITTKREITIREWKNIFDSIAKYSGSLPYWDEMLLRGIRANNFNKNLFKMSFEKKIEFPNDAPGVYYVIQDNKNSIKIELFSRIVSDSFISTYQLKKKEGKYYLTTMVSKKKALWDNLDLKKISKKRKSESIVKLKTSQYTLKINKTRCDCMCHDKFAVRLFSENKCVWKYQKEIVAVNYFIVVDFDRDGNEEILIFSQGHKPQHVHVFQPVIKEASN